MTYQRLDFSLMIMIFKTQKIPATQLSEITGINTNTLLSYKNGGVMPSHDNGERLIAAAREYMSPEQFGRCVVEAEL